MSSLRAQWSENFDDHDLGGVIGQGDWEGWDNAFVDADVTDQEALSPENSLVLRPDTDVVAIYRGFSGGVWTARAMVFIPGDHFGQTWFILLNTYNQGGPKNWSTQVVFEAGTVSSLGGSGFGGGGSLPIIPDDWVELSVEIDLDLNTQTIRYDGAILNETPWQVSGLNEIQAIDLYSAGGSAAYFDDISFEVDNSVRPSRAIVVTGACPDIDPIDVTVSQPVPEGADGAEQVTVVERVTGAPSEAITASLGGVKADLLPAGITDSGWIKSWFVAGPILNGGGAAPGEGVMRQDFLDDGDGITELDYEPAAGDEIIPIAGILENGFNPVGGGVLTVQIVEASDAGILDYNAVWGDINNVMVYQWAYVTAEDDLDIDLCLGSDDAVQVFIDGQEVHINNVARGWGGGCQDLVTFDPFGDPIFLEEGTHLIMMKVFEGGGGHRAGLQIQSTGTGLPAPGLSICGNLDCDEALPPVGTELTWEVTRTQVAAGIGYELDHDQGVVDISGSVDGNGTIGDRRAAVCLAPVNPVTGHIKDSQWAGVGPFTHPFACGGAPDDLLRNHLAPDNITCIGPSLGEEVDYDPNVAASSGYTGPTGPDGGPLWREMDDGNDDGFIDLELAMGAQDLVMGWLVTYVENITDDNVDVNFCNGSDDNIQVWVDDVLVQNLSVCRGSSGCTDVVPFSFTPGIHAIKMASWDNGGGWNISLAVQTPGGAAILPDDGLLAYHGGVRPDDYEVPECPECEPEPVRNLTCVFGRVGFSTGLLLSWENPATIDAFTPTRILIDGAEVAVVGGEDTSASIGPGDMPQGRLFTVSVIHCGGIPAECSPFKTDLSGYIVGGSWLALGPWATPIACDGNGDALLSNHIGPEEHISCQFPTNGDAIEGYIPGDPFFPDPAASSTLGYHPSAPTGDGEGGDGDEPIWRPFVDSSLSNADLDFDQDVAGNLDEHVLYVATWIENLTEEAMSLRGCFASDDDGQVWLDDQLLENFVVCRGRVLCQNEFFFDLPPGPHVIKIGIWEQGGGWGTSFGITDINLSPIIDLGSFDGDPILDPDALVGASSLSADVAFHGRVRPGDEEDYECGGAPQDPVAELACIREGEDVEVSWINPESNDPDRPILILVNGTEVDSVDGGSEEVLLTADMLGDADVVTICVRPEGAFLPVCCGLFNGDEIYINSGGPQFTDVDGRVWLEDTLANPSAFLTSQNTNNAATNGGVADLTFDEFSIDNNIDPRIFEGERWSDGPVEYTLTGLDDGATYDVTLFFMEHCCSDGCLSLEPGVDACESVGLDGEMPPLDAQFASATCRVFDILVNDELVQDQFSKNTLAACLAGVPAGPSAYYIGVSLTFAEIEPLDGAIKVTIQDLGGGNPPENASIKGLCMVQSGVSQRERNCSDGVDNDGDGQTDCDDSDCANNASCRPESICDDGVDNDGDGETDCADADCRAIPGACPVSGFVRGDPNSNGSIDLTDGILILNFLFLGGPSPVCMDSADADDNGSVALTDAVRLFGFLFLGGGAPAPPSPVGTVTQSGECGPDPTDDDPLDCADTGATCQ